jgi:hypothetical protein
VLLGLAQDASFYVVACYRLRHGGLPFGWVALLAQPTWSITVVLIGLAILLFPDGLLPSPRLRWLLWVYLAVGTLWMAGAFALTIGAIAGHRVSVDAEGNLLRLDHPAGSAAWWGTAQTAVLLTIALSWLISLAGQVISYRDSCGERRQQLKWLLGGSAASLVGVFAGITLTGPVRIIGSAGILVAYAIVTGLLIGVYAGLVLLATEVLKLKGPVSVAAVVQSVLEPAHLSVWTTPASDT